MTDTFTWLVQAGLIGSITGAVRSADFGDGYSQEAADGINPIKGKWPVSIQGYYAEIQPIQDFLDSHVGISFFWTPPMRLQGYYRCKDYTVADNGNSIVTLTANLYQVFMP